MIFDTRANIRTRAFVLRAVRQLRRSDPVLARLIRRIGPCQLRMTPRAHYFRALVEAILFQQLSGKAAQRILERFRAIYPGRRFPAPAELLSTSAEALRRAGFSRQKIAYLRDLAAKVADGSFPLRRVARMSDEEVIRHLTQVKGIGRWTAEMFLIFCLGRPDVLPLSDLGIRKAVGRAYGFKTVPAPRTVERLGRRWKPYRSIAAWYLWASVDGMPEPLD